MNQNEVVNFPMEFLKSRFPVLSLYILILKIEVPIILLQNINQPKLYNGIRLVVKKLMNNLIAAQF